jgi:hypothetical protein
MSALEFSGRKSGQLALVTLEWLLGRKLALEKAWESVAAPGRPTLPRERKK